MLEQFWSGHGSKTVLGAAHALTLGWYKQIGAKWRSGYLADVRDQDPSFDVGKVESRVGSSEIIRSER